MLRRPIGVLAAALAAVSITAAGITAAGITAAAAGTSAQARHGTEHFSFWFTSTKTLEASVIATGLFTDGGTTNLETGSATAPLKVKLGAGTIWLRISGIAPKTRLPRSTCLSTATSHGTYTLARGTGKYAGIHGSGSFSLIFRAVHQRTANGACSDTKPITAAQGAIRLSGPATLRS